MRRFLFVVIALALALPWLAAGPGVGSAFADTGSNWTGEYFNNPNLQGTPVLVRIDNVIGFDWGAESPAPGIVNKDGFSVRWTGPQQFNAGTYTFTATVDDGVRVFVDDVLVINAWYGQIRTTHTGQITLTQGLHWVRVEYFDAIDQAVIFVSWRSGAAQTAPGGWAAEYYNNPNLQPPQVGGRLEPTIDYNWGTASPIPGVVNQDNFSARWWGFPELEGGTYTFVAGADDGVRVFVDGVAVIDAWYPQIYTEHRGTVTLDPGVHTVRVEYFDIGDQARINVYWLRAGGAPAAQLPPGGVTGITATVTARVLNVRAGPGVSWERLTQVREGETYAVLGRNGDSSWFQISGPGFTGWVSGRFVTLSGDAAALPVTDSPGAVTGGQQPGGVVTARSNASLRIRRGPSTNDARIGALNPGETATVIGRTADSSWLQVRRADGLEGWVSAAFVTVQGSLAAVPVTG